MNTISTIQNTNSVIIGDFNINLDDNNNTNQRNTDMKDKLLNILPLNSFVQIIKECTRFSSNSLSTLIDHIWVSNFKKLVQNCIIDSESDHKLILTTLETKGFVKTQQSTNSRIYKNFNKDNSKLNLISQPWTNVYQYSDVKLITSEITNLFLQVLDKHAPKI